MVSTSGAQLLPEKAVTNMITELLPLTTVLTPNIPEATLILRKAGKEPFPIDNLEGLKRLAAEVHTLGPKYVLLKGGHFPLTYAYQTANSELDKKLVCNILCGGTDKVMDIIEFPYQKTKHTHGTGCSLASALACNLAQGLEMTPAVVAACRYVDAGIKTAFKLGNASGSGPINHFHSVQILPFPPGGFVDYLLGRSDVVACWYKFTHHEFVERLGEGTLEVERFRHYMIQDYLYLVHFARANALAAYKAKNMEEIAASAEMVGHISQEMRLHVRECEEGFGLKEEDLRKKQESLACTAYTRFVLDIGASEDLLALQIALLPCLLGYAEIARRLLKKQQQQQQQQQPPQQQAQRQQQQQNGKSKKGHGSNRYQSWIDNYVSDDYTRAVKTGCGEYLPHLTHLPTTSFLTDTFNLPSTFFLKAK